MKTQNVHSLISRFEIDDFSGHVVTRPPSRIDIYTIPTGHG
ncbi:unnamed protein product [Acanthoscelides obtectus]|uniref:Uncharacterized protein n=1 Tax=Acanthoscelides obtectus TaxID=200917 RepID=A0A9P0JR82_ACAOB|nr:unnamed protein product [Acanthoscelides obtectus]CAK1679051.1 hypothetical protein AOBTE_LOCUS32104 [Acanthoscelides obtectus]